MSLMLQCYNDTMLYFCPLRPCRKSLLIVLKIAPYRAENWALSIAEICADELFFVPLHCESSPREHWLRLGIERALLCIGLPPYLHLWTSSRHKSDASQQSSFALGLHNTCTNVRDWARLGSMHHASAFRAPRTKIRIPGHLSRISTQEKPLSLLPRRGGLKKINRQIVKLNY